MKTYILDAYPLIVFFRRDPGWEIIGELLAEDSKNPKRFLLTLINWGEIYYNVLRDEGTAMTEIVIHAIDSMKIEIIDTDRDLTIQAAIFKSQGGISFPDCFAAALAKRESAALVTGDPEFKRLEKNKDIKI